MTRETKIGLLVGLAFIIVIGILLSDHLTSSTEPPPAPMAQAGASVRAAVNTPVRVPQNPVVQVQPPQQVQPHHPVRTSDDLQPQPQPVRIVQIDAPQNPPVTISTPDSASPAQPAGNEPATFGATPVQQAASLPQPGPAPSAQPAPTAPRSGDPALTRLNQEAQRLGESIVPAGASAGSTPTAAARQYKAETGDSLSKIASKMYGSNARVFRDAIVAANPSLKDNPNLIIEGRTYVIPAVEGARTAAVPTAAPTNTSVTPVGNAAPADTSGGTVYVVREGDNLTRIATEQVGNANAVAAIKELNRELLKGSDVIRPGMKLRLPARAVAANN